MTFRSHIAFFIFLQLVAGFCQGCVIPAPYEKTEADAGMNRAVEILKSAGITPSPTQELIVFQSPNKTNAITTAFYLWLNDPDAQTLYARLFINRLSEYPRYNTPISEHEVRGQGIRGDNFSILGLCDKLYQDRYILELWVSDTPFVSFGDDLRKNQGGGYRDNIAWNVKCNPPLPSDGGV